MSVPAQTHPRRRGVKATSPQMTPLDTQNLPSIPKAGSFHSPPGVSSDLCNPIINYAFMPKRSSTSPDDLEELLNGAGVRRVTNILEQFDRTFAGESSSSPEASILSDREVLPVPNFILDNTAMEHQDTMDLDTKPVPREQHHASDSGIGSSINDSPRDGSRVTVSTRRSAASGVSAINKSFSAIGSRKDNGHSLGRNAIREIQDRIIKPILAEKSLKDFHPLVADVPHRIGTKDITNLRDLEKTLIFLAPDYSTSPALYLEFCELSIQCIHTTVEYLCERDQRLPTDRPYTNNYFLDLIEQIRRYAQIMATTRRKEENGEPLDETDYNPKEKITLRGGLSENGRPLELVRERDGKIIPIPEGDMSDPAVVKAFSSTKRMLEEEDEYDEDGVLRSMARRRKSEKPGDVIHTCNACGKDFKRPCDLTKHKKTHTRPFKCPEPSCKYHELGWPTEKECDRHYADKHSANPPQYKCQYPDCAYVSKRESNCKQHMEKSHGYVYNRTKSNGRKKPGESPTGQTPITPTTPFTTTPASALLPTPNTPSMASPLFSMMDSYGFAFPNQPAPGFTDFNAFRRDSTTTTGTAPSYGSAISPDQVMMNDFSPEQILPNTFEDAMTSDESRVNHAVFFDSGLRFTGADFAATSGQPQPQQQQPTPALSVNFDTIATQPNTLDVNLPTGTGMPHLSPNAQPDVTLFTPSLDGSLPFDEGYSDAFDAFAPPQGDFQLFDTSTNSMNFGNAQDLFGDINNMGAHFDGSTFDQNFNFDDVMHA